MRIFFSLLLILCFSNSYGQQSIVFRGNRFHMSPASTAEVIDPVTHKTEIKNIPPSPVTINGAPILDVHRLTQLPFYKDAKGDSQKLATYIFEKLKLDLQKLDDGEYTLPISDPVISKEGYLVYYKFEGIQKLTSSPLHTAMKNGVPITRIEKKQHHKDIPASLKAMINAKAQHLLDRLPKMYPAKLNGNDMNCTGVLFDEGTPIMVKDHKAAFKSSDSSL